MGKTIGLSLQSTPTPYACICCSKGKCRSWPDLLRHIWDNSKVESYKVLHGQDQVIVQKHPSLKAIVSWKEPHYTAEFIKDAYKEFTTLTPPGGAGASHTWSGVWSGLKVTVPLPIA